MTDAFIYEGLRTPFGRHAGALSGLRADDLLATTVRAALDRSPFNDADVEDVIAGCANQAGEDSRNVARHAALLAGLPVQVPGITVNRLCGSGLAAALEAARAIRSGEGDVFVTGGVEQMSRAPFVLAKASSPYSREAEIFDTTVGSRFPNPRIVERYGNDSMPETGDNIARDYDIGREDADAFAAGSQAKYEAARRDGFFDGEILPIEVAAGRKQDPVTVDRDEHPRPDSDREKLAKLTPLFSGGVVTAGNASGVNDGAGAIIVASRAAGDAAGASPRARIVTGAVAGVEPRVMGLGPVPASRRALERAGLALGDMDVIEINEAFASQVLGCLKLMEISPEDSRLNPNGGAIAVGHPLGASGTRLLLTATRQLHRSGGRYGLVSLCVGIGQGIAAVIERV